MAFDFKIAYYMYNYHTCFLETIITSIHSYFILSLPSLGLHRAWMFSIIGLSWKAFCFENWKDALNSGRKKARETSFQSYTLKCVELALSAVWGFQWIFCLLSILLQWIREFLKGVFLTMTVKHVFRCFFVWIISSFQRQTLYILRHHLRCS
jgi:hypothetical protein